MSSKQKTLYICQSCGHESPRWSGRCPQCREWNTLVETIVSTKISKLKDQNQISKLKAQNLNTIGAEASSRISTGIGEFDRVLGGGVVPGSVILLAGEPGVGKSTLLLQVAAAVQNNSENSVNQKIRAPENQRIGSSDVSDTPTLRRSDAPSYSEFSGNPVLYISGEESPSQLKLRADRLQIKTDTIQVLAETDVDSIIFSLPDAHRGRKKPKLLIVDSVQTLATQDLSAGAGTVSQVRECSRRLTQVAKELGIPLLLIGHVTKEGAIAGPKVLEHLVDVVLYLEGDRFHAFRLLRAHKNRYGSDQEVGVFAMGDRGLCEIKNPSDAFLAERLKNASGSVVTATMEGTRPVLVEIQALATNTSLAYPRRTASGFGLNRLNLLIAVLQKHLPAGRHGLKLPLHQKDIYVNVAGGFKITEPAADLAAALAIVSSVKDKPTDPRTCVYGEVGLSGEVRKVSQSERRAKEAKKLGFKKIISPEKVRSVQEAIGLSTKLQAPSSK